MKLFEVTNGWCGESYVRAYVWAENEDQAREVFAKRHSIEKPRSDRPAKIDFIKELFDSSSPAFSTVLSDTGWET